jgi:hypothetical protein
MMPQIDTSALYNVAFRRIGKDETLIGKIYTAAGPLAYFDAKRLAEQSNSKPFTPFFFFLERAEA